ncbi:MAG TPA: serine hydrolase [Patescibacteria group bacterium]|nr:serine hydrolase [Patescibacteria group bacterium]
MAETGGAKSNRRLIIVEVVIIAFSIGLYLWYNWSSPVEYERYNRFGLSFNYPEGMEFSETGLGNEGLASVNSGVVQGMLMGGSPELIGAIWLHNEFKPVLEVFLDTAFTQLGEGTEVEERNELVASTKDGYDLLTQSFTLYIGDDKTIGMVGTWYDSNAQRTYMVFHIRASTLPEKRMENDFNKLLGSFESSYEAQVKITLEHYWPTDEWRTADPEEVGIYSGPLDDMLEAISNRGIGVDSVTVVRDGYVVLDEYFSPYEGEPHIIYSCTKSVVSTIIGIAIEEGYIESLDVRMLNLFPDRTAGNMNAWKEEMTLRDLLTMTAGFDARDSYLYDWEGLYPMHDSPDALQYVLNLPVIEEPGTRFEYTNGVSHLLSCIITEKTGMSALEYGMEHLFEPLGIHDVEWHNDSMGRNWGYSRIYITPHDMAKLGYLFLNKGQWDGTQIVPEEWVEEATTKHVDATIMDGYGYQWWVSGNGYYTAVGHKGQFIHVVPELDIVAVFTSRNEVDFDRILSLLETYVIPAVVQ